MGIVNAADEQYGYVVNDPLFERHLSRDWENSVYQTTLRVLREAKASGEPTGRIAVRQAEKLSLEPHPIFGHRGRQIIDSLVADVLAKAGVSYGGWVDSWGFKEEAYDGCPWGFKIMREAGVNIVVNTDSVTPGVSRYLYLDVAKVLKYNDIPEVEVLKMITLNAARALEVDRRTGSLDVGKDGDIAVFNKHPLDSTTRCLMTIIEGEVFFDYAKQSMTAEGGRHE
jgi:hypothetical protein